MEYNKYEIKNVGDFLKIPIDRLDDCLEIFKNGLKEKDKHPNGIDLEMFTWIDDGLDDIILETQEEK